MTWQRLLDSEIQKFIIDHQKTDVAALALKKPPVSSWDYPLILDQIKARQKAFKKIPLWLAHHKDIIFPPSAVLEQASSAASARYKAGLVKGKIFVDLTGGAGVDTCAFAEHFERGVCVEKDERAAALLAHNLNILSDKPVEVICGSAEEYCGEMKCVDLVYLDPQRRDGQRKGKYRLEECSPDVFALLPDLLKKAETVMIKTSPMLDIWESVRALKNVRGVHIVQWRGECKEVLYLLSAGEAVDMDDVPVHVASLGDEGSVLHDLCFTRAQEADAMCEYSLPLRYLYEPSPAFQKSGAFKVLAQEYGVKKLHQHTHLYTSEDNIVGFPGRRFEVLGLYPAHSKKMPVKKANLTVRNFPQTVEVLRKTLKIQDGGDDYLFACTLVDHSKIIVHARK